MAHLGRVRKQILFFYIFYYCEENKLFIFICIYQSKDVRSKRFLLFEWKIKKPTHWFSRFRLPWHPIVRFTLTDYGKLYGAWYFTTSLAPPKPPLESLDTPPASENPCALIKLSKKWKKSSFSLLGGPFVPDKDSWHYCINWLTNLSLRDISLSGKEF